MKVSQSIKMTYNLIRPEQIHLRSISDGASFAINMYDWLKQDDYGCVALSDYFPNDLLSFWQWMREETHCRSWQIDLERQSRIQVPVGLVWVEQLFFDPETGKPRHGYVHAYFTPGVRSIVPRLWAVLTDAMRKEGFTHLYAVVHPDHKPCRMMLRRCGFEPIGVIPHYAPFGGVWVTMQHYWMNLEVDDGKRERAAGH